jgi:ATP-dependent Clp protease protease subunit
VPNPEVSGDELTMINDELDPKRTFLNDDDDEEGDECPEGGSRGESGRSFLDRHLIDSRTLLLSGPVTDQMLRDVQVRLLVMEARDPKRAINILINSPGGSADAGFAIYDMIRFVKAPVNTVVNGLCASAGVLIHLAVERKRRFCLPESRFMIHQPSTTGRGSASDLDITAKEIIKLRDRYNRIVADACGKKPEDVMEAARRDYWLSAGEALEYGLVAKVVRKHDDLPE